MSNIEIVRLNACFLQVFEVKWVKNNKCTIKDRRKPNVYVYEAYFIEKGDFLKSTCFFSNGEFLKTRNFLKNKEFCVKTPSLERGIFENREFLKKQGILC